MDPVTRERSSVASATLLSLTNSVVVFGSILPPFADVRKAEPSDKDMRTDVRLGELAASGLVIGVGIVASTITGSPAPAVVSTIGAAVLVFMYESVLNARGTNGVVITHESDYGVDY